MPIDPAVAIGAELPTARFAWDTSDVQLYHLGIGAGAPATDPSDLEYLDDRNPKVLPTFGTVAATLRASERPRVSFPGIEIDLAKIVHGSQEITAHGPLPSSGKATTTGRIADVGQPARPRARLRGRHRDAAAAGIAVPHVR